MLRKRENYESKRSKELKLPQKEVVRE